MRSLLLIAAVAVSVGSAEARQPSIARGACQLCWQRSGAGGYGNPYRVTISIVGTSDLHGRIAALPWFAGHLKNLREARARDGGAVVLVDAGDMFQGTLESNLGEGAAVIAAYNALGYAAVALGNHEFDFGPVGPAAMPTEPGDDPRGALKARAAQARFPFLAANVVEAKTHKQVAWPNVRPATLINAAGIEVGIVGVALAATGRSALPANVAGLEFLPLAEAIGREARKLRARGADVVVAVAHDGGGCRDFSHPRSHAGCDRRSAIFALASALPRGSVDALVGGHTHQAIAHFVGGVPVIQSYANGHAFGRIDLTLERKTGEVLATRIQPPREICPSGQLEACAPGDYEDAKVVRDDALAKLIAPALAAARAKAAERLGVDLVKPLPQRRGEESALGDWLADLARRAHPTSDLALLNGGGIRAGLPAGPLSFGRFYEAFPFDNASATVRLPAGKLRQRLARSLGRSSSLVSVSGIRVRARCKRGGLDVTLTRSDGATVADDEVLTIATTDFLATGGDGFFAGAEASIENGLLLRDAMVEVIRRRGGSIDPEVLLDPEHPRIDLPGPLPIRCSE